MVIEVTLLVSGPGQPLELPLPDYRANHLTTVNNAIVCLVESSSPTDNAVLGLMISCVLN